MSMSKLYTMWFQDGEGRTLIEGRTQLRKFSKRYDFNLEEVISNGETEMLDGDGDVVGGVFEIKRGERNGY
ncbi:MAG TPA: hypothetical protein DEB18_10060 [Leeuwenhoekiella sp.]|nr:hypothetical protein [Leeuwenhoekiella sp.]